MSTNITFLNIFFLSLPTEKAHSFCRPETKTSSLLGGYPKAAPRGTALGMKGLAELELYELAAIFSPTGIATIFVGSYFLSKMDSTSKAQFEAQFDLSKAQFEAQFDLSKAQFAFNLRDRLAWWAFWDNQDNLKNRIASLENPEFARLCEKEKSLSGEIEVAQKKLRDITSKKSDPTRKMKLKPVFPMFTFNPINTLGSEHQMHLQQSRIDDLKLERQKVRKQKNEILYELGLK